MSLTIAVATSSKPQTINGKIFPNGQCGWSVSRESDENPGADLSAIADRAMRPQRCGGLSYIPDHPTLLAMQDGIEPLGLSSAANSHKESEKRSRRGLKGLTSHGKRLIRNGVDYLEWRFGRQHLSFCTVTLPSVSLEESIAIAEKWAEIVRTFIQNIGRKLNVKGLPRWIVGSTEIQTKRYVSSGIAALHLHIVYVGRKPGGGWSISAKQIRSAWRSAIVSLLPSLSDRDFTATENVQQVRKSAGNYLSKYVSKGQRALGDVATICPSRLPTSWYTCTNKLRKLILGCVRTGGDIGSFLAGLPESAFIYKRRVTATDSSGRSFTVGYSGHLKPGWEHLVRLPLYCPPPEYLYLRSPFRFPSRSYPGFDWLRDVFQMYLSSVPVPVVTTI